MVVSSAGDISGGKWWCSGHGLDDDRGYFCERFSIGFQFKSPHKLTVFVLLRSLSLQVRKEPSSMRDRLQQRPNPIEIDQIRNKSVGLRSCDQVVQSG